MSHFLFPKYRIFPNFLAQAEHQRLLDDVLSTSGEFEPAPVYRDGKQIILEEQRTASRRAGGLRENKQMFADRISSVLDLMFDGTGIRQQPVVKLETELVANGDGGKFGRHVDTLTGQSRAEQTSRSSRAVSAVYYFFNEPKGFEGGELRLYPFGSGSTTNEYIDISPSQNTLVAFPSFASHEVLPVVCASKRFLDYRFSVNCWLHCSLD